MRAYGQQCYNFLDYFIHFSLSSQHISLCLQHSFLSLLSGLHLSLLPISFSLSFFFSPSLRLCVSFSLFFFPVTIFLSFFSCHEEDDFDLKQSLSIKARQSEVLLVDLKLCSPKGSRRSLLVVLHSRRSLLIVLHSSRRRWLVEFGHWLICWVGVLLKILSFFLVEVFGFGICWRIWWLWL